MERLDVLREVFDEKLIEILNIFLENPKKQHTLTDITDESGISFATAHRKLNSLLSSNIIQANKKSNAKKIHSYRLGKGEKVLELSKIFDRKKNIFTFR